TSMAAIVAAMGLGAVALADDHAEEFDLKAACEAFKADNPESKTDCQCLADKAEGDEEAMKEFMAFDPASGNPLGEKATKIVAACQAE
ncbi:MAG: hypothetical protein MRY72_12585, partial [Aquisalinus sp.]|nr:hypothetical protein [Aquisalinus sp.]